MPVDSQARGVLLDPAYDLRNRLERVSLVAGKKVDLGQPRQMLVSIQFEYGLGVPGGAVEHGIVIRPETPLPGPSRQRIEVPVDLAAQLELAVSQDFNPVFAKLVALRSGPYDPV